MICFFMCFSKGQSESQLNVPKWPIGSVWFWASFSINSPWFNFSVWHYIAWYSLRSSLQSIGITDIPLACFTFYLSDRARSVQLSMFKSSPACIDTGVPQGSVLGPLLFYFLSYGNMEFNSTVMLMTPSSTCLQNLLYF